MIKFITGKPGGGKSMYAFSLIVQELVHRRRDVVTNVPVLADRLSEYIAEKHPEASVDFVGPDKRLWILDDNDEARRIQRAYRLKFLALKKRKASKDEIEALWIELENEVAALPQPNETANFWKYRNPRKLRFDDAVGTLFVIDECHLWFNARNWQKTGEDAIKYLSQHRHFGDDVLLVTQHPDNVDTQFRRLVEDWTVVKNGYKQRLGWFRGMPSFKGRVYSNQPNGTRQEPFMHFTFKLDAAGLARCYNTAAAAGVAGNGADTKQSVGGLHPAWFPVMVLGVASVIGGGLLAMNRYAIDKVLPPEVSPPHVEPAPVPSPAPVVHSSPVVASSQSGAETVKCVGVAQSGFSVRVNLSNGFVLTERDIQPGDYLRSNAVKIGGVVYPMANAGPGRSPSPLPLSPGRKEDTGTVSDSPKGEKPASGESSWLPADSGGVVRLRESSDRATAFQPSKDVL